MGSESKFKETEIGTIPEDWDVIHLGEFGEFRNGVNFNRNDFGIGFPVVNVKNLFRGRYATFDDLDEIKEGTIKNIEAYKLQKDDVLFARSSVKRSGAGQVVIVNNLPSKPTLFSGFIIRFRNNSPKKMDNEFLNYLLRSRNYREYLTRIATGTTITNLSQDILSEIPIILPGLKEQQYIANILSKLDDKIELNQQINSILEKIGQAVFKYWFVDFEFPNEDGKPYKSNGGEMVDSEIGEIPKGWEIKPIDNVADFLNGLALQKFPPTGNSYLPVIKIRELKQGISESSDKTSSNIDKQYIVTDGDILFSWSGSLEVCIWCGGNGALNQHLFKVTSQIYPKWFYYYWIKFYLPEFQHIAEGKATTMGHIQRHHLSDTLVIVPPKEIIEIMNKVMNPLIDKLVNSNVESRNLSYIRDLLLPKLMSGKIRVNILEKDAGAIA